MESLYDPAKELLIIALVSLSLGSLLGNLLKTFNFRLFTFISVLLLLSYYALRYIPSVQSNKATKEQLNAEDKSRRTLAQIIGGGLLLAGSFVTSEQLTTSYEEQIAERFTRAVEQLGSYTNDNKPNQEVRMGGVYSLDRILGASPEDCPAIVDILSAYARKNASLGSPSCEKTGIVLDSLIKVLATPRECIEDYARHGRYVDLSKTCFAQIHLENAHLKNTNLSHAELRDVAFRKVDLSAARLEDTRLRGGIFSASNFSRAQLSRAQFSYNLDLTNKLSLVDNTSFSAATLYQSCLRGVIITDVDFTNAYLAKAKFSETEIRGTNFEKAVATKALFTKSAIDESKFRYAHLDNARFLGTTFREVTFFRTDLREVYFEDVTIDRSHFDFADIRGGAFARLEKGTEVDGSSFDHANLENANFEGSKLTSLTFSDANLRGVNFRNARLVNCEFTSSDLTGAVFTGAVIAGGLIDGRTKLDEVELAHATIKDVNLEKIDFQVIRSIAGTHLINVQGSREFLEWARSNKASITERSK